LDPVQGSRLSGVFPMHGTGAGSQNKLENHSMRLSLGASAPPKEDNGQILDCSVHIPNP
jgi:hypothetical protein